MKLYHSSVRQNAKNANYPYMTEINGCEDFIKAVSCDNTCAKCKDNYRKNANFLEADCSMFDVDNTHSENPEDWITPQDVRKRFPDVPFYVCYSRNNMKEKSGKAARPKFHIYFKDILFTSAEDYSKHKQAVCTYFTEFDPNAKDAARFFFGVENPQVEYIEGKTLLADFMKSVSVTTEKAEHSAENKEKGNTLTNNKVIPEGCRNNTLISYAASVLKRYGNTDNTAYDLYIKRSECCLPPLDNDEIQRIWRGALKFYKEKIKTSSDYVAPELYQFANNLIHSTADGFELEVRDIEMYKTMLLMCKQSRTADIRVIRMYLISFGITLRHNKMTHRIEISGLPKIYQGEEEYKTLITLSLDILAKIGFKRPINLSNIMDLIALENCYHPIVERINSEEWDGIDRITEIYNILGLTDDLSKSLVRKWAIQAIAMLYNDKNRPISAQGVLVLQGRQGIGKTEFFRHLAIDNSFFKEGAVVDVTNKDTRIATTSKWICEIGELDSTTAKKQAELKAFLTLATDEYRIPYEKHPVERARRTAFCGTVNPKGFLTDETGNRRYWTIHINSIDMKKVFGYSPEWYTQFWRQIFCEYIKNPKAYLLTAKEYDLLNKRNEEHESDVFGEDEFLSVFDINAPMESWKCRTATDMVSILNQRCPKLNMTAEKLGKTLLPKLERRFNVSFDKKCIGGRQYRPCPPMFGESKHK